MEAARSSTSRVSRPRRKRQQVPPCPCCSIQPLPTSSSWGAKRARTALPHNNNGYRRREWADLGDDPAGLIAERVLSYDVADYIRFHAVCRSWRRCSVDPAAHGCLDRRFHPRWWIMLQEPLASPIRRCYLNTSTAECVQVDIPELRDHEVVAVTPEGLLILARNPHRTAVRMLNPLTRHLAELPPLTTLLPSEDHDILSWHDFRRYATWGSVIANGDPTVVLSFELHDILGMAKPGDVCWTVLKLDSRHRGAKTSSMFAGRFYCLTPDSVMVLEDQPPRLELAAKLPMGICPMTDSAHLVDCGEELILVHRRFSRQRAWNCSVLKRRYDAYRVDLDARTLRRINNFGGGGRALFINMTCSFSVPIKAFPSGSIRGDTIYLSFDIDERNRTEGYNLANRKTIRSCNLDQTATWVAVPHTLVDCLSLCRIGGM